MKLFFGWTASARHQSYANFLTHMPKFIKNKIRATEIKAKTNKILVYQGNKASAPHTLGAALWGIGISAKPDVWRGQDILCIVLKTGQPDKRGSGHCRPIWQEAGVRDILGHEHFWTAARLHPRTFSVLSLNRWLVFVRNFPLEFYLFIFPFYWFHSKRLGFMHCWQGVNGQHWPMLTMKRGPKGAKSCCRISGRSLGSNRLRVSWVRSTECRSIEYKSSAIRVTGQYWYNLWVASSTVRSLLFA